MQKSERPSAPSDMVWIAGGTFRMGSADFYPEERPVHDVTVVGFWMDRDQVTNDQFARFVAATGYVTVAERPLKPADFPGAPPENLVPGSMVFQKRTGPVDLRNYANMAGNVWEWTSDWYEPRGANPMAKSCCLGSVNPRVISPEKSYDPRQTAVSRSTKGRQGRLAPVRPQLLPPLSSRRAAAADDRHRHGPHRFSLCPQALTSSPIPIELMPSLRCGGGSQRLLRTRAASARVTGAARLVYSAMT